MGWPKGKPRKPRVEDGGHTEVPEGGVSEKSGGDSGTGGVPRGVQVSDMQTDVRKDVPAGDNDSAAAKPAAKAGTVRKVPQSPAKDHIHIDIDWHTLPLENGEECLRTLREAYEIGLSIMRDRMRSLPPMTACTICGRQVPDGKHVARFVEKDPATTLNKIILMCSQRCYEQYRFSISAGSGVPRANMGTRT